MKWYMLGPFPFILSTAPTNEATFTAGFSVNTEDGTEGGGKGINLTTLEKLAMMQNKVWTGTDLGDLSCDLGGTIYPGQVGSATSLLALRAMAASLIPMPLLEPPGLPYKLLPYVWAINNYSETNTEFGSNGRPRKIDFSVSLTGVHAIDLVNAIKGLLS